MSESETGLLPGRFTRTRSLTWCHGAYIKVKQELKKHRSTRKNIKNNKILSKYI